MFKIDNNGAAIYVWKGRDRAQPLIKVHNTDKYLNGNISIAPFFHTFQNILWLVHGLKAKNVKTQQKNMRMMYSLVNDTGTLGKNRNALSGVEPKTFR